MRVGGLEGRRIDPRGCGDPAFCSNGSTCCLAAPSTDTHGCPDERACFPCFPPLTLPAAIKVCGPGVPIKQIGHTIAAIGEKHK